MDSLVLELQHDALSSDVSIGQLLRKALIVARKLSIQEFQSWVENELNGYSDKSKVPHYRRISGSVHAYNPFRGWQPVLFEDSASAFQAESRVMTDSSAQIEKLAINAHQDGHVFLMFPPEVENLLTRHMNAPMRMRTALGVSEEQFHGIIDAIRNMILGWALKLEEDGIMGEGMTFWLFRISGG